MVLHPWSVPWKLPLQQCTRMWALSGHPGIDVIRRNFADRHVGAVLTVLDCIHNKLQVTVLQEVTLERDTTHCQRTVHPAALLKTATGPRTSMVSSGVVHNLYVQATLSGTRSPATDAGTPIQ
jgi:hypothetical protein